VAIQEKTNNISFFPGFLCGESQRENAISQKKEQSVFHGFRFVIKLINSFDSVEVET